MNIRAYLDRIEAKQQADAERYANLDNQLCMACHAEGPDKRSLVVRCFYAMDEIIPEMISLKLVPGREAEQQGYFLKVCKSCRAALLGHFGEWWAERTARRPLPKDSDGGDCWVDERNVPVRINGATVMMTIEQYEAWRAEQEAR